MNQIAERIQCFGCATLRLGRLARRASAPHIPERRHAEQPEMQAADQ